MSIIIGIFFMVHLKYDWRYLFAEMRLAKISWSIARDSLNESLYKDRMVICGGNYYLIDDYRRKLNLDSLFDYDMKKRIELGTRDTSVYINSYLFYLNSNKYKKALDELTKAIKYGSHNAYIYRADLYGKLGMYDSAIADLKIDMKIRNDLNNYYMIGNYYTIMGQYGLAMEAFRNDSVDFNIVKLLLIGRKYEEAIKITENMNKYSDKYQMLAISYYLKKNIFQAIEKCKLILQENPTDYFAQYTLSKIYFEKGDLNNGILFLSQALENGFCFFDLLESDNTFIKVSNNTLVSHYINYYKQKNSALSNVFTNMYQNNCISKSDETKIPKTHNSYHIMKNRVNVVLLYPAKYDEFPKAFYLLNYSLINLAN